MSNYLPIIIIFTLATGYGIWYQRSRGKVKAKAKRASAKPLVGNEIGGTLGSRATFVQFSSAFCAPCKATHALLSQMVIPMHDVKHIHIDAESHLELVRQLDIRSTPTTIFLNKDGIEVGRAAGTPKREQVIAALDAIN